jgi:Flp pilus assembly protein TadD
MAQRGEGSHRIVRLLLRKMRNPAAIERDPYGLRLRDAMRTEKARDAVEEVIERALRGHDPVFSTIIRRCDIQGEMTEDVARDLYLSVRHFFRYRAAAIDAIAIALGRLEPAPNGAAGPRSDEARRALGYATYLSRQACDRATAEAALRWYERAVEAESTAVEGWIGISSLTISLLLLAAISEPGAAFQRAADAISRARSLQPRDAGVEAEQAVLALWSGSPTVSVRALAESVLAKDPLNAKARYALGWSAVFEHDLDTAGAHFRSAATADPGSLRYPALDYTVLWCQRRYDDVVVRARELLEINPGDAHPLGYLTEALNASGRADETVATLDPYIAAGRADHAAQAAYVRALAMIGDIEGARRIEARYRGPSVPRATMLVALNDYDGALAALTAAQSEFNGLLEMTEFDPWFDALRDDRRFKDLLRRRSA